MESTKKTSVANMDIWEFLKGLFKKSEESTPAAPYLRSAIERSTEEQEKFGVWKRTIGKDAWLSRLRKAHQSWQKKQKSDDENIDFLNTVSVNGFIIHFDPVLHNRDDFFHLMDYFREKTLSLGYVSYMSDERTYTKRDFVETIQRHYLKPSTRQKIASTATSETAKFQQLFGNVNIELLLRDDELMYLKLSVTTYNDSSYETQESFEKYLSLLLAAQ